MDKQAGEEETRTEIAYIDRWMNIQQLLNEAEYHLKNYGDRGMCYRPKQLTPSEISIILQMIRKPNSKIVLLFIQNNSQFKNKLNNAYLRRCLVHVYREGQKIKKGLFRSANILQIADVVFRVVFLLYLLCFQTTVRRETSKMFLLFFYSLRQSLTTKVFQTRPQFFSVNGSIICQFCCTIDVISSISQNSSKFGRQQLVMMNYAWDFSQ